MKRAPIIAIVPAAMLLACAVWLVSQSVAQETPKGSGGATGADGGCSGNGDSAGDASDNGDSGSGEDPYRKSSMPWSCSNNATLRAR